MLVVPPTYTTSLVLRCRNVAVAKDTIVQLIAVFMYKHPTWKFALTRRRGDALALQLVQWLYEHRLPLNRQDSGWLSRRTKMDMAVKCGFLSVVKHLYETVGEKCTTEAAVDACRTGHPMMVQYLYQAVPNKFTSRAWGEAARLGRWQVITFYYELLTASPAVHQLWVDVGWTNVMYGATMGGRLDVVKWLHAHRGVDEEFKNKPEYLRAPFVNAARGGHVDVVRFLHEHGYHGDRREAMDTAANKGHLPVVEYLHHNSPRGCSTFAMDSAAHCGHVAVVQFLHDHRTEGCTMAAIYGAAENGHVEILQILFTLMPDVPPDYPFLIAARHDKVAIVEFLYDFQDPETITRATDEAEQLMQWDVVKFFARMRMDRNLSTFNHDDAKGYYLAKWE